MNFEQQRKFIEEQHLSSSNEQQLLLHNQGSSNSGALPNTSLLSIRPNRNEITMNTTKKLTGASDHVNDESFPEENSSNMAFKKTLTDTKRLNSITTQLMLRGMSATVLDFQEKFQKNRSERYSGDLQDLQSRVGQAPNEISSAPKNNQTAHL